MAQPLKTTVITNQEGDVLIPLPPAFPEHLAYKIPTKPELVLKAVTTWGKSMNYSDHDLQILDVYFTAHGFHDQFAQLAPSLMVQEWEESFQEGIELSQLNSLTVTRLRQLAKKKGGIKSYWKMDKATLIDALKNSS